MARTHARLRFELIQRKAPISHRALDLLIAATAIANDLELLTNNRHDYDDGPGLKRYRP